MTDMTDIADLPSPDQISWWQQIELPGGYVTPGPDPSASKLALLRLPSLEGKTVLDIGANNGYFSFAAERMGASRVVALETHGWHQPGGKDGFEYARRALGSSVEDMEVEILDISPETVGEFDVVLFLDVLYHLRHPLLSLERIASVTKELLVMYSLVDLRFLRSPAMAFYPWPMYGDKTNWWGPNKAAVGEMLSSVGFEPVCVYPVKRFTAKRLRGLSSGVKTKAELVSTAPTGSRLRFARDLGRSVLTQGRIVAHGWK